MTTGVLTAREAFEALLNGKKVIGRSKTSALVNEYRPISEFAADIFTNADFEFSVQIETVVVSDIEFTKPYMLDELKDGDIIYVVDTTGDVLKGAFDSSNKTLVASVNNGFAQRNEENAVNQIKAWRKTLGLNVDIEITIKDFSFSAPAPAPAPKKEEKEKPKRKSKDSQNTTSNDVEKKPSKSIVDVSPVDPANTEQQNPQDEDALTVFEVWKKYHPILGGEEKLSFDELKALEAEIFSFESIKNAQAEEAITVRSIQSLLKTCFESRYKEELEQLTAQVQQAHTAEEANGVINQTKHWTTEQRAPLIKTISTRLGILQRAKQETHQPDNSSNEKPTLAARIEVAQSLEELDQIQLEINELDPIIHSRFKVLTDARKEQLAEMEA